MRESGTFKLTRALGTRNVLRGQGHTLAVARTVRSIFFPPSLVYRVTSPEPKHNNRDGTHVSLPYYPPPKKQKLL